MRKNRKRIFSAALLLPLLVAGDMTARMAPAFPQPMIDTVTRSAIVATDASEKSGIQLVRAREALRWAQIWEQLMADQAKRRQPPAGTPGVSSSETAPSAAPPAKGRTLQGPPRQQFSLHVDNCGTDNTGIWREGLFYTNRDLTGRHDRLAAMYMHTHGANAFNTFYSVPLGKSGAALDLTYITNTNEVVGPNRALGVHGFAWSVGADFRYPLAVSRDRRVEAGLAWDFSRQNTDMDHLPRLGVRAQVLRGRYNRFTPHISFAHYGDSSLLYHRHEVTFGNASTLAHGHQNYAKYQLKALYHKRWQHGQMLKARFHGQLAGEENLASLERFYLGGLASVRGYKESLISGDHGFAAGVQYQVPLEKTGQLSAFTFLDYGRVYGDSAPARQTAMLGTGVGLAYDTRDIHATLTLGLPLERHIAGECVGGTRLHFMLHASF